VPGHVRRLGTRRYGPLTIFFRFPQHPSGGVLGGHDLALAKVGRGPAQHEARAKRVAAHRSEIVRSIIVYHDVTDTDHWLPSPQRKEVLGPLGASNIRTFVDRENPQKVGVLMDIADLDSMLAAIANQSPELAAAMQHDTVRPETLTTLAES
jgi:hypothetical protein